MLSIIIPLYNGEVYIEHCVHSIYDGVSRLNDFEVIVINDGSTDNSYNIVQTLLLKYSNLTLLNEENTGTSNARNLGLEHAKGEFIWFIDADDYVVPGFLVFLLDILKEKCEWDVLSFNYICHYSNFDKQIQSFSTEGISSGSAYLLKQGCGFVWNKIYAKHALKGVSFPKGLINIEDYYFNIKVLINVKTVKYIPVEGYVYNCTNMISTSRRRSKRHLVQLSNDTNIVHRLLLNDIALVDDKDKKQLLHHLLYLSVAGYFFSLLRFYPTHFIKRKTILYSSLGLYPVKKTWNKKANLFISLVNNCRIFLFLSTIASKVKLK